MSHLPKQTEYMSQECTSILESLVKRVARVRVRLVIEAVLRTLALGLVILPVYVMIYAWIDHHVHFGIFFRTIALSGLCIATGWLLLTWARVFLSHVSLSRAANYIENKQTYYQQLVAAIEYYEQEKEYPYSRGLAEQMIRQVCEESKDHHFTRTIRKWPSVVSVSIVLCALISIAYLAKTNYDFYSRYLTRMVKPVANVKPMPATKIETLSGDIIAEPGDPLVLTAALKGRIPESGTLYVESQTTESNDLDNTKPEQLLSIPLLPAKDENDQNIFQMQFSLREKGRYSYYFKTGEARTQSHQIRITEFPRIESISAKVMVKSSEWVKPYTENVDKFSLSVFEDSYITLEVQANQPLKNASVSLPNQKELAGQLNDPNTFSVAFQSTEEGKLSFELTNSEGLKNPNPITLQIQHKQDMPPQFELISPGIDYIATNVASIPIEFKVTDDFALMDCSIYLEFNDGQTLTIPSENFQAGNKEQTLTYLLELENFDLNASDSIIFYASAKDADTHIGQVNTVAWSTPYFVEIRPYQKLIRQPVPSMPSMTQQNRPPTLNADGLLRILEYNRAFLKKTWLLSQKKELQDSDRTNMNAISDDITYASEQLALVRNNPSFEFSKEQADCINGILNNYNDAARTLLKQQIKQAIPPEKKAYHDLRGLILELVECPPPVAGTPPQTRDRLELKDAVHVTRYEKERIEWQMEKLTQQLAQIRKEQEKLEDEYVKFFKQDQKKSLTQQVNDAKTWMEKYETESTCPPSENKNPGQMQSQTTMQGATVNMKNPPQSAGGGNGQPQTNPPKPEELDNTNSKQSTQANNSGAAQGSKGQGGQGDRSVVNEMMRMTQSQQKMLQDRIHQLSEKLADLPVPDEQAGNGQASAAETRQAAREHLEKASESMDEFKRIVAEQYYQATSSNQTLEQATAALDTVQDELTRAELEMSKEFASNDLQLALGTESLAKKLDNLAGTYEETVSDAEKQRLQQLLQQATALMESMPKNLTQDLPTNIQQGSKNSNTNSRNLQQGNMASSPSQQDAAPLRYSANAQSGASSQGGSLIHPSAPTANAGASDAVLVERARLMARHFWSLSIEARKKSTPLTETQFTHPEFTEDENNFFEKTATYGRIQEQQR